MVGIDIKGRCRKHGELDSETGIYCKEPSLAKGYRLRCKVCVSENRVNVYWRNQQENIKKTGEWKKANRDKVNANSRKMYHKDIETARAKEVSRKKGLNLEEYYLMLKSQDNKCKICNRPERRKNRSDGGVASLCIDHNHITGRVRGLLCHDCNTALGKLDEKVEFMKSMINYTEENNLIDFI